MKEIVDADLDSRRKLHASYMLSDYLEGLNQRGQADSRRSVLVADNGHSFSFWPGKLAKLVAVAHGAHIPRVGMQQIY